MRLNPPTQWVDRSSQLQRNALDCCLNPTTACASFILPTREGHRLLLDPTTAWCIVQVQRYESVPTFRPLFLSRRNGED